MYPRQPQGGTSRRLINTNRRLSIFYAVVILVIAVIVGRLFYLQIIRHDHYRQAALSDQLKQYTIAPERGIIEAHQGTTTVPLVLNQKLYTLYADPTLVKDADSSAAKLANVIGGAPQTYADAMRTKNSRYAVLAKRLSQDQEKEILGFKLPGVGLQAQDYRVYPQGDLAAQILGFVDDSGQGRYGIEQRFNSRLEGKPGLLKAITDVNGVPLAASRDNIQINPTPGDNYVLTIDLAMQRQAEDILKSSLQKIGSKSGSVVIMDPYSGSIKAMANYPTFDPAKFYDVKDISAFNNLAVSSPLEVGSIMKTLTVSTGLDNGAITPDTTYQDPGYVTIDGATIKNVLDIPHSPTSIRDVLKYSLNTGAVHVLKELGGGQFNQKGRDILYDYFTNHFGLGDVTGVDLPNESPGVVHGPDKGSALNLQYANMAFGQGLTATILQMASALSSVINGGTYYQPHLVDNYSESGGKTIYTPSKAVRHNVVKPKTGDELRTLMEYVFSQNYNVYQAHLH
ncbi:MAG TPA: penicillin-binding protein 2, partial [Candidatus Saccharimonadales bacterium]|nr:penicillin-binding protein 2 [Candidatus Saccharimonadales bacterium]